MSGNLDDLNSEKSYKTMPAHMNTVAGNEALVRDSARRYSNATFFGVNSGILKTNICRNWMGGHRLRCRFFEELIGLKSPSVETYTTRIAPLLVSSDLESRSGPLFDRKGFAVLLSPGLTKGYAVEFMSTSEALISSARASRRP